MTEKHSYRDFFHIPLDAHGLPKAYFASHSLGLQHLDSQTSLDQQMRRWKDLGVDGWFQPNPLEGWYSFVDQLRTPLARIVGAHSEEVVVMNSLTTNLHLMLSSFYFPTPSRHKILTDGPCFPSDLYALVSQIQLKCYDPKESLVILEPKQSEWTLREEEIFKIIEEKGHEFDLILFNGVNFLTGQTFPLEKIARLGKAKGCKVGFDLAHAVGNIPLRLHDWNIDFAVWCNYKYLCGGPGSPGGAFVHNQCSKLEPFRLSGWWGNNPDERFKMHLLPEFKPQTGAMGWQLSTPHILSAAPLHASLQVIEKINDLEDAFMLKNSLQSGLQNLRRKYGLFEIITPLHQDGHQISLAVEFDLDRCLKFLSAHGVVCDGRPPRILRVSSVPAYSNHEDIDKFLTCFERFLYESK